MLNLSALKNLAIPKYLTAAHADHMRARRTLAATIQHNRQTAASKARNNQRKKESDAFRRQAIIDTAHHLRIPTTRLGLWLLYNYTPILLRTGRIIWLELRKLYPSL